MKNRHIFFFIFLTALLLSLPFYRNFSGIVLFIAWVPLLFVEDHLTRHKEKYRSGRAFLLGWLTFLIWNLFTIYWIKNATLPGAIAALIINSFFMALAFWLIHLTHRMLGEKFGYFAFLMMWTAYEHFYLNFQIDFPWLLLGNGFAKDIPLVQWYEFTGVLGGTLWVLFVNLLIFLIFRHYLRTWSIREKFFELGVLLFMLVVPVTYSLIRYHTCKDAGKPVEVVVVQPNIDPYNDKFSGLSEYQQVSIMLHLADSLVTDHTDYVVFPETAINNNLWEGRLRESRSIRRIMDFVRRHPKVNVITGATTWKAYFTKTQPTPTAIKSNSFEGYYDIFNAALQIDSTGVIQTYHKSKLVVGAETMPYPSFFNKVLGGVLIDLGGTTGSFGTQPERTPLVSSDSSLRVGVAICYESIFGDYVTHYVRNGANLLFVITNDGWWGNTPGYKQHMNFARLRAIENRRSIARSANTGLSCFIDQRGVASQITGWWMPAVIRGTIRANNKMTFYSMHGDYIGRVCDFFSVMIMLYVITQWLMRKKRS